MTTYFWQQVTVNVSGDTDWRHNFVNPAYRVDHSAGIVNTTSVGTKPVQVSLLVLSV